MVLGNKRWMQRNTVCAVYKCTQLEAIYDPCCLGTTACPPCTHHQWCDPHGQRAWPGSWDGAATRSEMGGQGWGGPPILGRWQHGAADGAELRSAAHRPLQWCTMDQNLSFRNRQCKFHFAAHIRQLHLQKESPCDSIKSSQGPTRFLFVKAI